MMKTNKMELKNFLFGFKNHLKSEKNIIFEFKLPCSNSITIKIYEFRHGGSSHVEHVVTPNKKASLGVTPCWAYHAQQELGVLDALAVPS